MIDYLRFKINASKAEIASKLSMFFESNVASHTYDFVVSDLLYFRDEELLLELRENPRWQALEREFVAAGGLISEDWEEEIDEAEDSKPVKVLRRVPRWKSRAVGLLIIFIVPAIVGGILGWLHPYQLLPRVNCSVVKFPPR